MENVDKGLRARENLGTALSMAKFRYVAEISQQLLGFIKA